MDNRPTYMNVTQDEMRILSGTWVAHPRVKNEVASRLIFLSLASDSETPTLALAHYDFKNDVLTGKEPILPVQESPSPTKLAMHPKGDGVVVSFDGGCKLFSWEQKPADSRTKAKPEELYMKLIQSETLLSKLDAAGPQNCLAFNPDGSLFATGGEDGCIRVFRWPSLEIWLDVPKAFKSVKDLDFSLDSALLSATAENSACRVWKLSTGENVATLEPMKGEKFVFCRFSQDAPRAFLFISLTKDNKGYIGVWDIFTWKRIGAKKFLNEPITALAVTHHGRRVAMGTRGGDICVVLTKKMEVEQNFRKAHTQGVTALEFSLNDRALLSVASDCTSRVTALDLRRDWKDWQIYLLFIGFVIISMIFFYTIGSLGDFEVPDGRRSDATPANKFSKDDRTHEEL